MILKIYQWLFALSFVNVFIAFWCILAPFSWAEFIGVSPMTFTSAALFSIWGGTLLGLHVLYLPGLFDPLKYQCINWTSIAVKFWMSLIFITHGFDFWIFAAWDFTCGSILLVAYLAVLITRKEAVFMNA